MDSVWLAVDPTHMLFGCAVRACDDWATCRPRFKFPIDWDDNPDWVESLSDKEREERTQAMASFHLPFLNWLDVSFQRLELQFEESEDSLASYDKEQRRWIVEESGPLFIDPHGHPYHTGGDLSSSFGKFYRFLTAVLSLTCVTSA